MVVQEWLRLNLAKAGESPSLQLLPDGHIMSSLPSASPSSCYSLEVIECERPGGFDHDPGVLYLVCTVSPDLKDTNGVHGGGRRVKGSSSDGSWYPFGKGSHHDPFWMLGV